MTPQPNSAQPETSEPVAGLLSPPADTPGKRERLMGVDAARGVALLGMMAVHSLYQYDQAGRPTLSYAILAGRAAAAFAVLTGLGIAFMTGRRRVGLAAGRATVAALGVRALVIAAIGFALGYTDASLAVVILPYYAVMFVLAIPLVFLPTWSIATLGVAIAAGMPALGHLLLPQLPAPTLANPTIGHLINDPLGLLTELSITGEFPALPWLAYLCAGLVIGRLDLTRTRVAVWLIATGAVLAAAAATASSILLNRYGGLARIWAAQPDSVLTTEQTSDLLTLGGDGTVPTSTWWWLAVDAPHTGTPFDLMGTTGTAIAVLGVMLLAGHATRAALRGPITVVQGLLAGAGSMTLTLYTAHIMFINSDYDTYRARTGYFLQAVAVLLIGLVWRATAGRGPLEGLAAAAASGARRWAATASRRPRSSSLRPPDLIRHEEHMDDDGTDETVESASAPRA